MQMNLVKKCSLLHPWLFRWNTAMGWSAHPDSTMLRFVGPVKLSCSQQLIISLSEMSLLLFYKMQGFVEASFDSAVFFEQRNKQTERKSSVFTDPEKSLKLRLLITHRFSCINIDFQSTSFRSFYFCSLIFLYKLNCNTFCFSLKLTVDAEVLCLNILYLLSLFQLSGEHIQTWGTVMSFLYFLPPWVYCCSSQDIIQSLLL